MNQILITGDEKVKVKKEKKTLPVNVIIVFFAVSIIILGICMISGSVYAKEKINEVVEANAKPQVDITRNDDNNTIEINVKHVRGITKIAYKWNDEDETVINGKNRKNVTEPILLTGKDKLNEKTKEELKRLGVKKVYVIGGENTLTVSITEENGQTVTYEKKYKVGNIPVIKLEAVSNGVQVTATSEITLNHITYSWDDGEEQKIDVTEKKYQGVINAPKGLHTLKIEVVDSNNMKAKKEQAVVGDTEPTLTDSPQLVNGKATFVIDASDDEEITTMEITHNNGAKKVINVNDKTAHQEVVMTEGETNYLIVTVTNVNGLSKTIRHKFDNF